MIKRIAVLLLLSTCWTVSFADDSFFTLTRRSTPRRNLPSNVSVVTAKEIQESGAHSLPDVLDRHSFPRGWYDT
jgi:outer membrane cobalamin receptor